MPMSKATVDRIHRARWGRKRPPSVQLRVDASVAALVRRLPERDRRAFVAYAVRKAYGVWREGRA